MSFYRRLNIELDQELAEYLDMLFGDVETSNHKVLNKLEEKLNAYIQELPDLGFNSSKYDLNTVKEFLFPYLSKYHSIKFTFQRNSNHICLNRGKEINEKHKKPMVELKKHAPRRHHMVEMSVVRDEENRL